MIEESVAWNAHSLDDKKKNGYLKSIEILHKRQLYTQVVQLVHLSCTVSVTSLYNGDNFIYMHKLYVHIGCVNHVSNGLVKKEWKTEKHNFFFQKSLAI